jgi:hypothetical protein
MTSTSLYGTAPVENVSSTNTTSLYGGSATVVPDANGNLIVRGDLTVLSGNIFTTSTTGNIFPANATTISIGLAGTDISIGASTGTTTINNNLVVTGSVVIPSAEFGNITLAVDDANTISTVTGNLKLTSANNAIELNAATQITGDFSTTANRLEIISNTGASTGLRVSAPTNTTSSVGFVSARGGPDINNGPVTNFQTFGDANSYRHRISFGEYVSGTLNPTTQKLNFFNGSNSTPFNTVNPNGVLDNTDLTTKLYVDTAVSGVTTNQLINGSYTLTLNADGTVSFPNYKFPVADGSANQVLQTNGSGILSWSAIGGVTSLTGGGHITVSASTGAVTLGSDATSNNVASTIVSRNASGNFVAGTIFANLSGTATNVSHSLTAGTHLSGGPFDGTSAVTLSTDATSANTASTIVARDASGDFSSHNITLTGELLTNVVQGVSTGSSGVGIYSYDSNSKFYVQNGEAQVVNNSNNWYFNTDGTTQFPHYKFPSADGTVNQLLSTNGSGVLGWANPGVTSITGTNHITATTVAGAVTVTSDGTNANTASTLVARDASGNFSAGTITAALNGNAATATKVNNALTVGTHLSGGPYDGSAAVTLTTDATDSNIASTIVARDASGNFTTGAITLANGAVLSDNVGNSVAFGDGAKASGVGAVTVGYGAGGTIGSGSYAIAIGDSAGGATSAPTQQQQYAIAIGYQAGQSTQYTNSIAIGKQAGQTTQNSNSIAIGNAAGNSSQSTYAVAIGYTAGNSSQGNQSIAIGGNAGNSSQGSDAIAIGYNAGNSSQGIGAVAVGGAAGNTSQGTAAIAIGESAGVTQGNYAVAIGSQAGYASQGNYAIAVGYRAGLGTTNAQAANTIILNATGSEVDGVASQASSFYVAPIRNATSPDGFLQYNASTKEVTYYNTGFITSVTGTNHISATTVSGAVTVTSDATSANTNSTIVARDSSGNFTANVITMGDSSRVMGGLQATTNSAYTFLSPNLNTVSNNNGLDAATSFTNTVLGNAVQGQFAAYAGDTFASTAPPQFAFRQAAGTSVNSGTVPFTGIAAAGPSAVASGTIIGNLNFSGYATTGFSDYVGSQGQGGGVNNIAPMSVQGVTTEAFADGTLTISGATITAVSRVSVALASVAVTGTKGQISFTSTSISVGYAVVVTGTNSGSSTGITAGTYFVAVTNGSTTATLSATPGGPPITTTAGTTTGLTFTRQIITVTYSAQTYLPFGLNAKVTIANFTNVTAGTYLTVGTSTTTSVNIGAPSTGAVSLPGTQSISCPTVTNAGTQFRVRAMPAGIPFNSGNRVDIITHSPSAAVYRADSFTFNAGAYGATGTGVTGNNIIYNRVYGQWQYDTTITPVAANTAYVFPIGTADLNNIATVASTSHILPGAAGQYNLQFSVQCNNSDNGADHEAFIWLRKNGVDVAGSTGRVFVTKGNATITGWNYLVSSANTTDYFELAYAVDNTSLTFPFYASNAFAPSTAALITTLTPVGA